MGWRFKQSPKRKRRVIYLLPLTYIRGSENGLIMVDNMNFQKAVDLINKSSGILITTHTKLDGDACGCIAVMCDTLSALGKKPEPIFLSPVPEWYRFLFEKKIPVLGEDVSLQQLMAGQSFDKLRMVSEVEPFGEFDLIIVIDTNSYDQLPKFSRYLKQTDKPVLVIDHHITADDLGDVELIDSTAAATGLIVFDLLRYAGWSITERMADALFVAIATDTGWFQFNNTDSRALRCCAELIDAGVNPTKLYHDLYQNFSPQRFKLMAAMLDTLELDLDGRFATQYLRQADFERTGATYDDTENLINECRRIGTVEVAALFVELRDGRIKCSLRSRGAVDVSEIAAKFGGGGHKMAAGAYLPGPLENAKQLIMAEIRREL